MAWEGRARLPVARCASDANGARKKKRPGWIAKCPTRVARMKYMRETRRPLLPRMEVAYCQWPVRHQRVRGYAANGPEGIN
ncbi:hypothetical protein D3C87_1967950 [compost metagenome]